MLRIEVKSEALSVKEGTSKAGRPYSIREQTAYVSVPDSMDPTTMLTQRIAIALDNGQQPYKPGVYQLSPTSFEVSRYGSLMVGRVKLLGAASSVKAAA